MSNPNARVPGESTPAWLERLINDNAPEYTIVAVQQLLVAETARAATGPTVIAQAICYTEGDVSPVPYAAFPEQPQPRGEYFVKSAHYYLELWRRRLVAIDPKYTIRVNVASGRGSVKLDGITVFKIRTGSAQQLKALYIAFRLLDDNFQQLNAFVSEETATETFLGYQAIETPDPDYDLVFTPNPEVVQERVVLEMEDAPIVVQWRANRLRRHRRQTSCCVIL